MTGQPLVHLLECPPYMVRALRAAWSTMQAEDAARQKAARHGR